MVGVLSGKDLTRVGDANRGQLPLCSRQESPLSWERFDLGGPQN